MSLVFYDTETTGAKPFFDQILQFAAIRTNDQLKELDRFEVRCRLLPHVVPAPEAMRVTNTKLARLIDRKLPSHYEMVRAVRAKMEEWSPSLFLGWNSIRFDEELMRQAFYKTLHKPYLTNTDGNSRSDAMRILQACSVHAPGAVTIPIDDDGQPSFKLDQVAPANGFAHARAHDAMGDVEAMKFVCGRIQEKADQVWSTFMRFSTKAAVVDFISNERVFCISDCYFARLHSFLVTMIGRNQDNGAEWYVFDLSVDPAQLVALSPRELAARLDERPKPVRRLRANAAPMLFAADDAPNTCGGKSLGTAELERRAAFLQDDPGLCQRLVTALESLKEEYPASPHVERQIYDGFFEKSDEALMDRFHQVPWTERLAIVNRFQDPRLKVIGMRLIHVEQPHLLEAAIRQEYELARHRRLLGEDCDPECLSLPDALWQLEQLLSSASGPELELLHEHGQHLRMLHQRALAGISDRHKALPT